MEASEEAPGVHLETRLLNVKPSVTGRNLSFSFLGASFAGRPAGGGRGRYKEEKEAKSEKTIQNRT